MIARVVRLIIRNKKDSEMIGREAKVLDVEEGMTKRQPQP